MRIAWLSNAPWSSTGYGVQTRLFVHRLKESLGHEPGIIAFWGLQGGQLNLNGIPILPNGFHPYGQDVVGAHSTWLRAEVTISLMDAWVCEPNLYGQKVRWAPWFPIDMEPLPPLILAKVQHAYQPIVMSRFGERMAREAGLDPRYVPHGVDTAVYQPGDPGSAKAEARERLGLPKDAFVIGMVAANKGTPSRKAFPEQLAAFAQLRAKHSDALLYLHTTKGAAGEHGGVNLPELAEYLGITDSVIYCDQYQNLLGFSDGYMADAYRAMDVLTSVSMGEGFGIPILEAQACGTPVIVGDWTAMSELCWGGWAVDKAEAMPIWTGLASRQWLARSEAIAERLELAYITLASRDLRARKRDQAVAGAAAYDADLVTATYWKPLLEELAERIAAETTPTNGTAARPSGLVLPQQGLSQPMNRQQRRMLERVK